MAVRCSTFTPCFSMVLRCTVPMRTWVPSIRRVFRGDAPTWVRRALSPPSRSLHPQGDEWARGGHTSLLRRTRPWRCEQRIGTAPGGVRW
eukprot:scaffold1671_cov344-Pavlova_lutheri.AAC.49